MSRLYFSADLHEGHHNNLRYSKRPFKSVEEQHEAFVKNFNSRVDDEDTIIHNGDYCFRNSPGGKKGEGTGKKAKDWQVDYKGKWIYVAGNHDRNNSLKTPIEKLYLRYGGKRICVVHNPKYSDPYCELNFTAHVHLNWKIKRLNEKSIMINIGVDQWNYFPVTYEEINKEISKFFKQEKINATRKSGTDGSTTKKRDTSRTETQGKKLQKQDPEKKGMES